MNLSKNKRYLGIGFLAAVAICVIAPQETKADAKRQLDGVMGQSIMNEMSYDAAIDYRFLASSKEEIQAYTPDTPLLRASAYTTLFTENSFTTVSDFTGGTYYHKADLEDREMFNGIDVSYWQADSATQKKYKTDRTKWTKTGIDWEKVHDAGVDFTFVRAASRDTADGSIYEDKCASAHIQGAQDNDINVGLYIFSQAINTKEAVEEADYVLDLIDQYGWDVDMPIIMDREAGRATKRLTNAKLSKAKETAVIQAFADEVVGAGYKAGVYASHSWIKTYINTDDLQDCAIWIARYNNTTTSNSKSGVPYADTAYDYEYWQYSSSGKMDGYASRLDVDFWYKDTDIKTTGVKMSKNTAESISLKWDDAGDAEVYRVYRYNSSTGKYEYVTKVADTSYTDTNLKAGKEYQYKVRCMWTIGGTNYYGKYSSVCTAVTVPAQVQNVVADAQTATSIDLAWDGVSGADGYRVYQYNEETESYDAIATVDASTLAYKVENLGSAKEYLFKTRAYKAFGSDTYWGADSVELAAVTKPGKVKTLKLSTKSSTVTLKWSKVAHATGYRIYRLNAKTGKYEKIATVKSGTKTSYTDKKLKKGSTYSYKVRAYMNYNESNYYGSYSSAAKIKVK